MKRVLLVCTLGLSAQATAAPPCDRDAAYRTADGRCAHLHRPDLGKNETVFMRRDHINRLPDRTDVISGTDFEALGLPAPRTISNTLAQFHPNTPNPHGLSNLFVIMGQFIAHDFADLEVDLGDFPVTGDSHDARTGAFPGMLYPAGDPGILDYDLAVAQGITVDGEVYISVQASLCHPSANGDCEFINRVTHHLDGSNIYGSDETQTAGLRTFEDGLLKTASYDIPIFGAPPFVPPVHLDDMPVTYADGCNNLRKVLTLLQGVPDSLVTCVGDSRGHENVMLTAVHVIWMREHNRRARALAAAHPDWDDEALFQEARRWTIAHYHHVIYEQWLPALLGSQADAVRPHQGYRRNADPRADLAFTTAAFRIGHTMVPEFVVPRDECLDSTIAAPPPFNALPFAGGTGGPFDIFRLLGLTVGIDPVIRDMALSTAFDIDPKVEDSIRDIPGSSVTFDTLATNINRGRMNGIASYTQLRFVYRQGTDRLVYGTEGCEWWRRIDGQPDPIACFTRITGADRLDVAEALQALYGEAHLIDAWPGLMSEARPDGSLLGATAAAVIGDQFTRFRDSDRFYYTLDFDGADRAEIEATTLRDIVLRNTAIELLPPDLLRAPPVADHGDYKAPSCP